VTNIPWLNDSLEFPSPDTALVEPDGLLAAGGDLSTERLIEAYKQGIFPWYSDDQPILWWSPNPRCTLKPEQAYTSKSLKKHIRKTKPRLSFDLAFEDVIHHCTRLNSDDGTWITREMEEAYIALHHLGIAHSVEVWENNELTGGLYGLAIGRCFFGESMFSLKPNSSKVAFTSLCAQLHQWDYALVDCQVENPHLLSLGANCIDRTDFLTILRNNINQKPRPHEWCFNLFDQQVN